MAKKYYLMPQHVCMVIIERVNNKERKNISSQVASKKALICRLWLVKWINHSLCTVVSSHCITVKHTGSRPGLLYKESLWLSIKELKTFYLLLTAGGSAAAAAPTWIASYGFPGSYPFRPSPAKSYG